MNKKLSSRVPCESLRSRGISRVGYLGLRAIPGLAIYGLLSQLFRYRATRCVWADLQNWRLVSSAQFPLEIRPLGADEIRGQAERTGEDPESVDLALGAGAEVFGAIKGASIESTVWVSPFPPVLHDEFVLEFEERLAFFYRAFTLPEFRGRGLMPALLQAALARCASRDYRGAIACIDIANRPSQNAFRSAGFKTIATFRSGKILGRQWMNPARSQSRPRFRIHRFDDKSRAAPLLSE